MICSAFRYETVAVKAPSSFVACEPMKSINACMRFSLRLSWAARLASLDRMRTFDPACHPGFSATLQGCLGDAHSIQSLLIVSRGIGTPLEALHAIDEDRQQRFMSQAVNARLRNR